MNVAEQMESLLQWLKTGTSAGGYLGNRMPLQPEMKDQWGPNYAIVRGYYFDREITHKIEDDFEEFVLQRFTDQFTTPIKCVVGQDQERFVVGQLVVKFYRKSQEIEVYREGFIVINDEEFLQRKDEILNVLNLILDPESWWEGNCGKGWSRKMSIVHQVERLFHKK